MCSFDDSAWNNLDLPLDYTFIDDVASNFSWVNHSSSINIDFAQTDSGFTGLQEQESQKECPKNRPFASSIDIDFSRTCCGFEEQEYDKECPKISSSFDFSRTNSVIQEQESEKECPKKRGRTDACSKPKTKACRERERREKLNDSFLDLSSILEPGRAAKTDKLAILTDAIKVLKQLRTEAEEYKEENKKLHEEIESLKAEKNELREEKSTLKAEKEKMEQQMKAMTVPSSGIIPPYPPPAAYHAGPNKMALYPSYGMFPMWHYLPASTRDTSRDHELRPPAA